MPKVLFVATVVKTHIMEFHIPYLKEFKNRGWETSVAAKNDFEIPQECIIPFCDHYYNVPFDRSPFSYKNIDAFRKLQNVINSERYDIIHCHTPVGAALTRFSATQARRYGSKVVYTAHGFHFYKGAPVLNWLLYYPIEKILAKKTDAIVTINHEDYLRARQFSTNKVAYIPGVGIDIERFCREKNSAEDLDRKKNELKIPESGKILVSVGELNENKNHRIAIEALPTLEDWYYVICGDGPLMSEYRKLAISLGVEDRLLLLGYRADVDTILTLGNVFVFPSIREGLPVSVMEAMSVGLPIVCAPIRGCIDLIENGRNGYFFEQGNSRSMTDAILNAYKNKDYISKNNENDSKIYSIEKIKKGYFDLYYELLTQCE